MARPARKRSGDDLSGPAAKKQLVLINSSSVPENPQDREKEKHDRFSSLPVETLRRIMDFVTPDPFELSSELTLDHDSSPNHQGRLDPEHWADFLSSRGTIAALTRTSKKIGTLALPYLYRNLVLVNLGSIESLLTNLVRHPRRGAWIHRLTLALPSPAERENLLSPFSTRVLGKACFPPSSINFVPSEYREPLKWLRDKTAELAEKFPAGFLGTAILPILSLTPNLTTLNVWGVEAWWASNMAGDDPFFMLLDGIALHDPAYSQTIEDLFPVAEFGGFVYPGSKPPGPMTFPPPSLETIVQVSPAPTMSNWRTQGTMTGSPPPPPESRYITQRLSFLPAGLATDLINIWGFTRALWSTDGSPGAATLVPSDIVRTQSADSYIDLRADLDRAVAAVARMGAPDGAATMARWVNHIRWLRDLPGNEREYLVGSRRDLELLDKQNESFVRWFSSLYYAALDRLPLLKSCEVRCPLLQCLRTPDGRARVYTLRLTHPDNSWITLRETGAEAGRALAWCLKRWYRNLRVLDMAFRLYVGNRCMIYRQFDPSVLRNLRELTITLEGLWGPLRTVMEMLKGNSNRMWELQRIAIRRLPESLETLRLMDWFSEYHVVPQATLEKAHAEQDGIRREVALLRAAGAPVHAVLATYLGEGQGQVDDDDDDDDSDDDDDDGDDDDSDEESSYYDYPLKTYYDFSLAESTFSGAVSNMLNPFHETVVPLPAAELVRQYISAFMAGFLEMCSPVGDEPALIPSLRPKLKRIEFVYCLQSHDPLRGFQVLAHMADLTWRRWYYDPGVDGYPAFAEQLKSLGGLEFVVWEEKIGEVPQEPVVPGWIEDLSQQGPWGR